jgi:hypothetical protein
MIWQFSGGYSSPPYCRCEEITSARKAALEDVIHSLSNLSFIGAAEKIYVDPTQRGKTLAEAQLILAYIFDYIVKGMPAIDLNVFKQVIHDAGQVITAMHYVRLAGFVGSAAAKRAVISAGRVIAPPTITA